MEDQLISKLSSLVENLKNQCEFQKEWVVLRSDAEVIRQMNLIFNKIFSHKCLSGTDGSYYNYINEQQLISSKFIGELSFADTTKKKVNLFWMLQLQLKEIANTFELIISNEEILQDYDHDSIIKTHQSELGQIFNSIDSLTFNLEGDIITRFQDLQNILFSLQLTSLLKNQNQVIQTPKPPIKQKIGTNQQLQKKAQSTEQNKEVKLANPKKKKQQFQQKFKKQKQQKQQQLSQVHQQQLLLSKQYKAKYELINNDQEQEEAESQLVDEQENENQEVEEEQNSQSGSKFFIPQAPPPPPPPPRMVWPLLIKGKKRSEHLYITHYEKYFTDNFASLLFHAPSQDIDPTKCYDCLKPLEKTIFGVKKFDICNHCKQNCCDNCLSEVKMPIISNILENFDFTPKTVSLSSHTLLATIWEIPMFCLVTQDKVVQMNEKLQLFFKLKRQLQLVYDMICFPREIEQLLTLKRMHLCVKSCTVSLNDLKEISSGTLNRVLKIIIDILSKHVLTCEICYSRGSICQICKTSPNIFSFDIHKVAVCQGCKHIYHRKCLQKQLCVRCYQPQQQQ